jgi:hypothetical protein
MDEKSLYAHILNLSAPWQVTSLSLDENGVCYRYCRDR